MSQYRKEIYQLIQSGDIPAEHIDQAFRVSNITPSSHAWKNFLSNLLLWLGVVALTSAVMFFIAYNWDALGRFAKFGLVEALIAGAIFIYWRSSRKALTAKTSRLISQAALLGASLLLGVLLAFYGQTYQTGADTWQLFFTWCVLILPWTIIAAFPALWLVWLTLLNLSIILYSETFRGIFGFAFASEVDLLWVIAIVNGTALILWELLSKRYQWLAQSWATRIVAIAAGTPLTFLVINSIMDYRHLTILPSIVWLIAIVGVYIIYRERKTDLFMLALGCLSGISVLLSFAGKILFDNLGSDMGGFLGLTVLAIVLGGASAIWLKKINNEQHQLEEGAQSEGTKE